MVVTSVDRRQRSSVAALPEVPLLDQSSRVAFPSRSAQPLKETGMSKSVRCPDNSRTIMSNDPMVTAVHECGHVLAFLMLGQPFIEVSVKRSSVSDQYGV